MCAIDCGINSIGDMKKYSLALLTVLMFATEVFSASFRATVDRNPVTVGTRLRVTYQLDDNGSGFEGPSFRGFKVLGGPNQSTQMSYVNGRMSRSLSMTYILAAVKEGKYTIAPAKIKVDGKVIKSNSLTIEVLPETEAQKRQREEKEQREQTISEQARDIIKQNLFVRLSVNKTNVYKGEPITATYKIYRHPDLNIASLNPEKAPVFNGFWAQEFDIRDYDWQWDEVNGVRFLSAVVHKVVLIPQRAGKLELEAYKFNCTARLQVSNSNRRRSFFDDPFFSRHNYRDFDYLASSGSRTITVKPLPENAPESFTGTVGKIDMESWFDVTETKTGEPVTLNIRITGSGNLRMIDPPIVKFPPDFEVYDPKMTDNTSVTASTISGNILYEHLAMPRNPGEYKIEPVEFSYFDFEKEEYVTLKSEEYTLKVKKGKSVPGQSFVGGADKEDVEMLDSDIKYIKTEVSLSKTHRRFLGSVAFWILALLPCAIFALLLAVRKKIIKDRNNQAGVRNRKAAKTAKKRLSLAKSRLDEGDKDKYFEELVRVLWGYLSDKLSIPTADLSKDNVADILTERQVPEEISAELLNTLELCEFARYAPDKESAGYMQETYENARTLIISLEGIL